MFHISKGGAERIKKDTCWSIWLQGSFHRNEIELQAEQIISSFLNGYLLKYYGLHPVVFLKTDAPSATGNEALQAYGTRNWNRTQLIEKKMYLPFKYEARRVNTYFVLQCSLAMLEKTIEAFSVTNSRSNNKVSPHFTSRILEIK